MDKQKKKLIKRYITWATLALVVLILSVLPLIAGNQVEEDGPQASILTTSAQLRDLNTQIIGGGPLSSEAAEAITIPEAIKITKYLVGNGDTVKKGDPIARVDKVSVMLALEAVQETLDYLAGELADAARDTDPTKVPAPAGGLVKIVYARQGDSVRDIMLKHGALAILSLNGRMAVDIETDQAFSYGDSVRVTLASGQEVTGKVESCVAGVVTISVEDDGFDIDQTVTVVTHSGTDLGSGKLYIHSPWKATAYNGTVSAVNVKEGDSLRAGKTLFQLDVTGQSSHFQILNAQRQEYEEMMQELFLMYDSGVVTAPCNGFVSGVDKNGTFLLAAPQEQGWYVQTLSNTSGNSGWTVMLLSDTPDEDDGSNGEDPGTGDDTTPPEPGTGDTGTETPAEEIYVVTYIDTENNCVYLQKLGTQDPPIQYPALVYSGTETAIQVGDQVKLVDDKILPATDPSGEQIPGGIGGGMIGFIGGFGGGGGTVPSFEPYSLETLTIAHVTSQEKMTLEISVDEQDITKLRLGQEATVTVEALPGQIFPAAITTISNTGTNEGGSSKFTVKLTLSKAGDMLPGMNASAFINLQTTTDVLTLPVAALVEEGSRTLVYTSYDAKTETLGSSLEVTTGISDGEYVQILSGLSLGDKVMYAYYDTPETTTSP